MVRRLSGKALHLHRLPYFLAPRLQAVLLVLVPRVGVAKGWRPGTAVTVTEGAGVTLKGSEWPLTDPEGIRQGARNSWEQREAPGLAAGEA